MSLTDFGKGQENMKFSIIVVCLNPGARLNETLQSVLMQSYGDYEIIVKDGGSRDGSVEAMLEDSRIHLYQEKDTGIYDAMNQAVLHARGEYLLFLNCGDIFYDNKVLEKTAEYIDRETEKRAIFYGDTFGDKNGVLIASAPRITGFTCYRNIPCHQVCFYAATLCKEKPYDLSFKIRADYDHFLWCFYKGNARMVHMNLIVASYEGDGFSEKKENRERDGQEHHQITQAYMSKGELLGYRLLMLATLAPLRRWIAENRTFSGVYHRCKEQIYKWKG